MEIELSDLRVLVATPPRHRLSLAPRHDVGKGREGKEREGKGRGIILSYPKTSVYFYSDLFFFIYRSFCP